MMEFILIALSFFTIYLLNKYRAKIVKKTKLVDKPDIIRKFHKKQIPLLGGIMVFSSFILINFYLIFLQELTKTNLIIFACCMCCLVLGLIDDIKKISYKFKFLILIIIFYLFASLDQNLQINKIYFFTLNKDLYLNYLSMPFTILCLLLLINAINLIDGVDGLCILIAAIFLTWPIYAFQNREHLYIVVIISLIYILYLNLKKNIFLGDSGSLFLGCLIGLNVILNYNREISKIHYPVENIFITFMLPGLDMLRVFATRIFNNKNPFLPDRTHLHYLLLDYGLGPIKILTIFFIIILSPIIINQYSIFSPLTIILFYIFLYTSLVIYLKKFTN
jgi:UDP-GlcNAc:undecaprenyl-phosphate/decaprenyl-phosphate GlcNAc-1-phosphate transferase